MERLTIHIVTKDRSSELGFLLESIRRQTYQNFDIVILDDSRPVPVIQTHTFINMIIDRLIEDGHKVIYDVSPEVLGVCQARNYAFEIDTTNNPLVLRIDDDSILESDYLERLVKIMEDKSVGACGGIVPNYAPPRVIRDANILKIFNKITFDSEGNINMADDGGYEYENNKVLLSHHLRSSFIMRREIHEQIGKYPLDYGISGFREESIYCLKIAYAGWKMMTDTGAIAWHLRCPSGGVRHANYVQEVQMADQHFKDEVKKLYKEKGEPFK
jgi:GT2 family glycosyltransferase